MINTEIFDLKLNLDMNKGFSLIGIFLVWWSDCKCRSIIMQSSSWLHSCSKNIYCTLPHLIIHHFHLIAFQITDSNRNSLMPFTREELVHMSWALRNTCLGMVELAYPETTPSVTSDYSLAMASVGVRQRVDPKRSWEGHGNMASCLQGTYLQIYFKIIISFCFH